MDKEYRARGFVFRPVEPKEDAILRAMLRDNPMEGWVRLSLEREPDYRAGAELMGACYTVLAREGIGEGRPVGMYACSTLPVYLNGEPKEATYLGGLRVLPEWRHRIRVLRAGYASIPVLAIQGQGLPSTCFTSIAVDNGPARRLLEADLPGLPCYRPLGELVTLVLPAARGRKLPGYRLRHASSADIPALVKSHARQARAWQFAPVLRKEWLAGLSGSQGLHLDDFLLLEAGNNLGGCLALWDQRACKQTVARGYRFPLNVLRPVYNLGARFSGGLALPPVGRALQQIFLAFAVWPEEEKAALALLGAALAQVRARGGDAGILGLAANHPLLPAICARYKPRTYTTLVETVHWPEYPLKLSVPDLDQRPAQPEVALL